MANSNVVHVAVGVISDDRGRILLTQRPAQVHQGGYWEFPGGKLEPGEDVSSALVRELDEELGIRPLSQRPLIQINNQYPEVNVLLDVWRVDDFDGPSYTESSYGCEGQPVKWVLPQSLNPVDFPAANRPIITAVQLPAHYLFTPEPGDDVEQFLDDLKIALRCGIRLVRLRAWTLSPGLYAKLAQRVAALCYEYQAALMLSSGIDESIALLQAGQGDGLHLSSQQLFTLAQRPSLSDDVWLAASCHNAEELARAQELGVDFVVVSPVLETPSHPHTAGLGWIHFQQLVKQSVVPVFALGGLTPGDTRQALALGGQGIAAIRSLWGNQIDPSLS